MRDPPPAALLLRVALLLCAHAACAQEPVPMHHMHTHAAARADGPPRTPVRADFIGTQLFSSAPCSNALTCSPTQCTRKSNSACAVTNQQGPTTNKTTAVLASTLASVQSTTCTVSSDARCTTAALTAVFGHYPGILAAYCNANYLVIHTSGLAAHPTNLGSIFTPPGGGTCSNGANPCGYADQCVTRDYATAYAVYKFPLVPTLLATASGTVNNAQFTFSTATPVAVTTSLGSGDPNNLMFLNGLTSIPTSGPVAVSVSGQNMFPTQNNNGGLTFPSCETDMCNAHAGKGFDYHYHGDPFGPQCLYSCANYSSLAAHPPLIGYGLDGVPIFGRYLNASAPGGGVSLDDCGGHVHSGIGDAYLADVGYHYHAFVATIDSLNYAAYAYTAYLYGPHMCWKGNISSIPNFWEENANPTMRSDYISGQIKPCSGNANMFVASGLTINGVTGAGFNYASKVYTVGAGSAGGACSDVGSVSPSPSPSPVAYIAAAISLGGFTTATFGSGEALAFRTAVSTKTGAASAAAVTITAVTAATAPGRRRTHAAGNAVVVSFTLTTTAAASSAASTAAAAISVADFAATGLAVTAVTVTTAPAATLTVPVDASAALPTTPALRAAPGPAAASAPARSARVGAAVALACAASLFMLF